MVEANSQRELVDILLEAVNKPTLRAEVYKAGRKATGGKNACAATASYWLHFPRILQRAEVITWADDLAKVLIERGCQRIDRARDVRAGDVIFTLDSNGNGASDHVVIAASDPDDKLRCIVVDNQHGGKPHLRNLVKGYPWKTPMWYALRLPEWRRYYADPGTPKHEALLHILGNLHAIYSQEEYIPTEARELLNHFANHPFLDCVRR